MEADAPDGLAGGIHVVEQPYGGAEDDVPRQAAHRAGAECGAPAGGGTTCRR